MLAVAYERLPKQALSKERFEAPVFESLVQGTKTIVKNFSAVVRALNREPKHLVKFLTNEFGVPIAFADGKLSISGKFYEQQLNAALKNYLNDYVLCHECRRPDTKIIESPSGIKTLKCDACGASKPVKRL